MVVTFYYCVCTHFRACFIHFYVTGTVHGVLIKGVSSFQGCPYKGVPLYSVWLYHITTDGCRPTDIPEIDAIAEIAQARTHSLIQPFLADYLHLCSRRVVEKLFIHVRSLSQHQLLFKAEPLPERLVLYPPHTGHDKPGQRDGACNYIPFCWATRDVDEVVLSKGVCGAVWTLTPTRG